ncbi:MAG: translation initiation factor IF-3 [Candidatus Nealsonbacteria bacterium]|nr:translation initiation factor IF-3 [Candidatus Nealsonbacteria bacterium]
MFRNLLKKPLINNQIRAKEVRLVDEAGKQLGIIPLMEAFRLAQERNLDLIQITEKLTPPVCKITDYGKYLYYLEKKERGLKKHKRGEIKRIRLTFNISKHDLETRAYQAEKFLKRGDKVKIELVLRGRQKFLQDFAKEKINQFLETLKKLIPIKVERELKQEIGRLTMVVFKN